MRCFLGLCPLSCLPARSRLKAIKTPCPFSAAPLTPGRMFPGVRRSNQPTFSDVHDLFPTAAITERGPALSFCGRLQHLCLYWSGRNNAGPASSARPGQRVRPFTVHSAAIVVFGFFRPFFFFPFSSLLFYPLDPAGLSHDDVAALGPEITGVTQRAGCSLLLSLFASWLQSHTKVGRKGFNAAHMRPGKQSLTNFPLMENMKNGGLGDILVLVLVY